MVYPALSFRSRLLSFLLFLFALVFGLLGAAPLINNALYANNKIFSSWLLISFQSDNQWSYPLFFWLIAATFLFIGLRRRRRASMLFNQTETTRRTRTHSPEVRLLLRIGAIGVYIVLLGFLLLFGFTDQVFNPYATSYKDSLSYQGHVYLLSVAPGHGPVKQEPAPEANTFPVLFNFEVSQCDVSGWFCHVVYDEAQTVRLHANGGMTLTIAELVDAHLQADTPHQRLFIVYQGERTSKSGKLVLSIAS